MNKRGISPIIVVVLLLFILLFAGFLILNVGRSYQKDPATNVCEQRVNRTLAALDDIYKIGKISEAEYVKIKTPLVD